MASLDYIRQLVAGGHDPHFDTALNPTSSTTTTATTTAPPPATPGFFQGAPGWQSNFPEGHPGENYSNFLPPTPAPAPAPDAQAAAAPPEAPPSPDNTFANLGTLPPAAPPEPVTDSGKSFQEFFNGLTAAQASGEVDFGAQVAKFKAALGGDESAGDAPLSLQDRLRLFTLALNDPAAAHQELNNIRGRQDRVKERNARRNLTALQLAQAATNNITASKQRDLQIKLSALNAYTSLKNEASTEELRKAQAAYYGARAANPEGVTNKPLTTAQKVKAASDMVTNGQAASFDEALAQVQQREASARGAATPGLPAQAPGAPKFDFTLTKPNIIAAFQSGKITRDQANQLLAQIK